MAKTYKAIDFYLEYPIWMDLIFIVVIVVGNLYAPNLVTIKFKIDSQLNLLSSLIGTSVSLAGFILAALTIIVSFKSNIVSKRISEARNPLELLFSTRNYPKIIKVFKEAMIELTATFVFLYSIWLTLESLTPRILFYSNFYCAVLILLAVVRTLFVLFLILSLDTNDEV